MGSMNKSGGQSPDVGLRSALPRDSASNEGKGIAVVSDEEAAKWTGLLLNSIKHELPAPMQTLGIVHRADKVSDREVTSNSNVKNFADTAHSHSADTDGVNLSMPRRLQLTVNSETLGRVHMIVDRQEGGISVILAGEKMAKGRLSADKHNISEALTASGVRVSSLRIVGSAEVGTLLAQDPMKRKSQDDLSRTTSPHQGNQKSRKGKKNNLNLVG